MKNKKILIIGIIVIAVLIALIFILVKHFDRVEELSNEDKKILAYSSYINYAWGKVNQGTVIFNDGTIYTWDVSESDNDLKTLALTKGIKSNKFVSKSDLKKINDLISKLEDNIEIDYSGGADMGTGSVSVMDIEKEKEIVLSVSGDWQGENKDKNAQQLLKILDKYFKK